MAAHRVQDIAENKNAIEERVVKRFYSEVIAGAEERASFGVPNCKRKIAAKLFDASGSPSRISVQQQLRIVRDGGYLRAGCREGGDKFGASIEPHIGGDVQMLDGSIRRVIVFGWKRARLRGIP